MIFNRNDIYQAINDLDNDIKLLSINFFGTHFWSYSRLSIYYKLVQCYSPTSVIKNSHRKKAKKTSTIENVLLFIKDIIFSRGESYDYMVVSRSAKFDIIENQPHSCSQLIQDLKKNNSFFVCSLKTSKNKRNLLDVNFIHKITKYLSIVVAFNPIVIFGVWKTAIICKNKIPLNFLFLVITILKGVTYNISQKCIYNLIFNKKKCRVLFFSDFASHIGAISASKIHNILTIDIQHGMFGPKDPSYNWPNISIANNPVPKKLVVYGDWWKSFLEKKGPWKKDDIIVFAPPYLFDSAKIRKKKTSSRISVLFATQWTTRLHSITFIRNFIDLCTKENIDLIVNIKRHPSDIEFSSEYEKIQKEHPDYCHILDEEKNIYDEIICSSLVVSYASTTLIESISLGTPAVSLCCETMEGGFADLFNLEEIKLIMPHILTPASLLCIVKNKILDHNENISWKKELTKVSSFFFKRTNQNLLDKVENVI